MTAASLSGTTTKASTWQRRRFASAALRVAATLVPIVASIEVSLILGQELPAASTTVAGALRVLLIATCSLLTLALTDAVARKFLPLAALLQLSLVFPDRTPSRFRTALKGGSGRRLAREVAHARREGLSDDPSRAAEQLLILASAIGDHDRRTRGHSERVRLYTELIAEELHLSHDERWRLQWAALIHDIGKITVPPEILNKKGAPDAREWAILKRHPTEGAALAAPVEPWLGDAVHAVGGHHERWDGGGYPNGLAGDAIPRSAAIVAVADAFEVMTAIRSYKKALPLTEARAELTRCAGTHFSPEVVRALLNVSIGRLRSSMGVFAAVAHLPFLGQIAKATSYAPDAVSTSAGLTVTGASAGISVIALSGGLAIATTAAAPADVPRTTPIAIESNVVSQQLSRPDVVDTSTSVPDSVASAETDPVQSTLAPIAEPAPTTVAVTTIPAPPVPADVVAVEPPTNAQVEAIAPASAPAPEPVLTPAAAAIAAPTPAVVDPAPQPSADAPDDDDDDSDHGGDNSGKGSGNSGKGGNHSGKGSDNSGKGNSHDDDDDDDGT